MLWRSGPKTGVRQADRLGGAPKGETYKKFVDGIALGRAQTPEDVAAFVSYLAGGLGLHDWAVRADRRRARLPLCNPVQLSHSVVSFT